MQGCIKLNDLNYFLCKSASNHFYKAYHINQFNHFHSFKSFNSLVIRVYINSNHSIQFNSIHSTHSIQFNSIQFNSIQFNSIHSIHFEVIVWWHKFNQLINFLSDNSFKSVQFLKYFSVQNELILSWPTQMSQLLCSLYFCLLII